MVEGWKLKVIFNLFWFCANRILFNNNVKKLDGFKRKSLKLDKNKREFAIPGKDAVDMIKACDEGVV